MLCSQYHEFGVFIGTSNTIGDIGSRSLVQASSTSFGVIYKWNVKTRYSFRGSIINSTLLSDDSKSKEPSRKERGYVVSTGLTEFTLAMEFNFFNFNVHDFDRGLSPYTAFGITLLNYQQNAIDGTTGIVEEFGRNQTYAIPMIFGVKSDLSKKVIIGAELGARYTFTDNLDGSNPLAEFEEIPNYQHGVTYNNDWYLFFGISLNFTFGKIPCYCKGK